MTHHLTTRPNLDHFRGQAKTLLAELRAGETAAARAFIAHFPKAHRMSPAEVKAAGFRLADAQSVVARRSGFESWRLLSRHVEQLRALEGEWLFERLEVDGSEVPSAMISQSKLLFDGDRFRMESPEARYEGRFTIDASTTPMRIDIDFVEGPEAGSRSIGLFALDEDRLTISLGLVGASRPTAFVTRPGSGHALEHLRRASAARPAGVTGGVAARGEQTETAPQPSVNPAAFAAGTGPMLERLEGTWTPVRLVTDGEEMRPEWLAFGTRIGTGNEAKVVFNGQVMLHVKMRIEDGVVPIAVDYLHLHGRSKGKVSHGIMEWVGDEVVFLIAAPGQARPASFASTAGPGLTLSRWRRS